MAEIITNPASAVFKVWGNAIKPIVGKNNYSMESSMQIASAPYAQLKMLGNPTHRKTLENDEISTLLSFQCESFADGQQGIEDAYNIDAASHKAMISLGFQRIFGPELVQNADSNIKRVISRYRMTYTGQFINN